MQKPPQEYIDSAIEICNANPEVKSIIEGRIKPGGTKLAYILLEETHKGRNGPSKAPSTGRKVSVAFSLSAMKTKPNGQYAVGCFGTAGDPTIIHTFGM